MNFYGQVHVHDCVSEARCHTEAIGLLLMDQPKKLELPIIPSVRRIPLTGISGGTHQKQETPFAVSIFSENVTSES